ncbi:MAG: hypothetical protein QME96_10440 [Myxococcota bacterium]|nr:hypothetical protein [Myxococcota bacterium]
MKFLLDTNIFIAAEETTPPGPHPFADQATRLLELAAAGGHDVFLPAASRDDLSRDRDPDRTAARRLQIRKYKVLDPVPVPPSLAAAAGYVDPLSDNDRSDLDVLASLHAESVDLLVTQDADLVRHAERAGIGDRVLTITDAIDLLASQAREPVRLPTLREVKAYELAPDDPIFAPLRAEYGGFEPSFDDWMRKIRREHRPCLVLQAPDRSLDGVAILKMESDRPHGLPDLVLKLCTFRIAEQAVGVKRGELLLRGVLEYARQHEAKAIYVEVFDRHADVLGLLVRFGFEAMPASTSRGERVVVKPLRWSEADRAGLAPLPFHVRYGPPAVKLGRAFVVPVEPRWHEALFPEIAGQQGLWPPGPPGNAMTKAYLCRAPTTQVEVGATMLFYRSQDAQAITTVGVVDRAARDTLAARISALVGQRTVYDPGEVERMCAEGPPGVLAILFRWDRNVAPAWGLDVLVDRGVLRGAPQSITEVTDTEGLRWLREQLGA